MFFDGKFFILWEKALRNNLLFLAIFLATVAEAQSWQQSYNSAIQAYSNEDYQTAFSSGEQALNLASSTDEKLYSLKLLSATCNESGDYEQGLKFGKF